MFGLFSSSGQAESLLASFIQECPIALTELNTEYCIVSINAAFSNMLNVDAQDAKGKKLTDYLCEADQSRLDGIIAERVLDQAHTLMMLCPEGKEVNVSLSVNEMKGPSGEPRIFVFFVDITEQKNLEMRFAHSQKMQAVGQLAGGVAHDFNNLLTAMIGFCDLLLMRHPAGDPSFADIMQVKQNANRAANLVRQLLAFSRRQTLQPKKLDLVDLISELSNLIRRLIGENIDLQINHQRGLWPVKVDQGQLEQVMINLAVNARDAMEGGGKLSVETENISVTGPDTLDDALRVPPQEDMIAPGDYVAITISDSGTGIPESVIDNIFEPFFSTKAVGSGTGLGLSTVYGIIKQTGGYIYLKTEENVGTSFHLYIPRLVEEEGASTTEESEQQQAQDLTGAATVLLVEDETPVRIFAARALQNKGYQVLEADCGESGIEVYEANQDKIEIIVTDVVMPGMNGPTMIETLDKDYAESMAKVNVMFMSGYAEDAFADGYDGGRDFNFLAKPFTLKQLAAKLKDMSKAA